MKATKPGEMGGRESEHSIVPLKRGNTSSWTPWREGSAASRSREQVPHGGLRTSIRVTVMLTDRTEDSLTRDVTSRMP